MPASNHLSPEQLHKIAQDFHQEKFAKWKLEEPKYAEGMCDTCTNTFLRDSGIQGARGHWFYSNKDVMNHKVAIVPTTHGEHVVDLTYNQFVGHIPDEKTPVPVPLVEPLETYKKRPLVSRMTDDIGSDDYPEWLELHPHSTASDLDPYLKYGKHR